MNKHDKITLQCADCDQKYKKTLKWLENAHTLVCAHCDAELDIDEVYNDVMTSDDDQELYVVYQK